MFFGTFYHNLDNKGRMVIPSKFRKTIGENAKVYIIEGFEGCLSIYPELHFQTLVPELQKLQYTNKNDRSYIRTIFSSMVELEVDSHNRLSIPKSVLDQYQIGADVSVVGVGDHFEIWNKDIFENYRSTASANLSDIADKLGTRHE